ncbi:hypothetical protein GUJ93_ZPchr0007g3354 [Zizania palustris]|uniref:Phosphoribosyltransferase domain-containing protein n=1 Tax=Zizania palustris TaxID=103762 RepID=A0A8J5T3E1_ZIZPA|nr:hypothetical protein GUJ93_ZPchr0007g3354 [Zizania palustris]
MVCPGANTSAKGLGKEKAVEDEEAIMVIPLMLIVLSLGLLFLFSGSDIGVQNIVGPVLFVRDNMLLFPVDDITSGGTVTAAVDLLKDHGAEITQIRIISAVAAPPALKKLHRKFLGICVYTGALDQNVNEKGFIVPGLGMLLDLQFAFLSDVVPEASHGFAADPEALHPSAPSLARLYLRHPAPSPSTTHK